MLTHKLHTWQLTNSPQPFHSNDHAMHFTRPIPNRTAVRLYKFSTCLRRHRQHIYVHQESPSCLSTTNSYPPKRFDLVMFDDDAWSMSRVRCKDVSAISKTPTYKHRITLSTTSHTPLDKHTTRYHTQHTAPRMQHKLHSITDATASHTPPHHRRHDIAYSNSSVSPPNHMLPHITHSITSHTTLYQIFHGATNSAIYPTSSHLSTVSQTRPSYTLHGMPYPIAPRMSWTHTHYIPDSTVSCFRPSSHTRRYPVDHSIT